MLEAITNIIIGGCRHRRSVTISDRDVCLGCAWYRFTDARGTSRWYPPKPARVLNGGSRGR